MNESEKKEILKAIESHKKMVDKLASDGIDVIAAAAEMITESLRNGGCIYICGNGGSAADAQHIAGEFVSRFRRERRALAAVALSTDTSILTSIGNDYSYKDVFARQVEALVRRGDVLWALSTSGGSENVILAAKEAKNRGAKILAFTGRVNSNLEKMADVCLCAGSDETFQSQQIHQIAYHIICDIVEKNFCQ